MVRHERAGWRANQPCTQPAKELLVFSENHRKPRRAKLPGRLIKNNPPQNLPPTDGELCFLARTIRDRELLLALGIVDPHAFAGKSQLDRICRNEKPGLLQTALPWLEQSVLERDSISRGSRRLDLEAGFSLARDQTRNIEARFFHLRLQTGGFSFFGARRRGLHGGLLEFAQHGVRRFQGSVPMLPDQQFVLGPEQPKRRMISFAQDREEECPPFRSNGRLLQINRNHR